MKLIKATQKNTGKVRWFSTTKEIREDRELMAGRDEGKAGILSQISRCLAHDFNSFNGWLLSRVEVREDSIEEVAQ